MTERLYYDDPHLTEFDARVLDAALTSDGRTAVRLDRTAFYPTGGGQPTDTGVLGASRVVECVDLGDGGVLHYVEGEPPAVGETVRGRVDWPRRLDHIQQHTGQHILSQAFVELYGAETRSFRMTADASEIDVALADPSDEKVERAVGRADEVIWSDREVRVHYVTPEEAARMPLRRDTAREGELRVIEVEGFDYSPCGGTHALRTGEVGLIAVKHWERAKGLSRVTFVAGGRALADYRRANRAALDAAALFSVGRDEVARSVSRLLDENKRLTRRLREREALAARAEAREMLEGGAGVGRGAGGVRVVARVFDDREADDLKGLALALAAHEQTVALLGSRVDGEARLVFARSADSACDVGALMRAACGAIGGRGGGRTDFAQGGGPDASALGEALSRAARQALAWAG